METIEVHQNLKIPNYIIIGKYKYTFKRKLVDEKYSYRCYHRSCKVLVTINKENLIKMINNNNSDSNETIEYTDNGKEHNCLKPTKTEEIKNIKTDIQTLELAKDLINQNIDKPVSWHINNFKNNNLIFTKFQIKNLLQEQRQLKYEPDNEFLLNIANINITFSNTDESLQILPFCFGYQKFTVKKNNNYKEENFILFTTIYQLKKLINIKHIYMDGTFKYCPRNYYQIYNIIGLDNNNRIPIIYILMSSKSYELYIYLFNYIKSLILLYEIDVDLDKISFTIDFEKAVRKAIIKLIFKLIILKLLNFIIKNYNK